jgi:protein-S-isoprenylcysteine O-methyltransferase Ste14
VGFVVQLYLPIPIRSPGIVRISLIVGLILVVIGIAFAFSALGIFRKRSTTTIPFETPTILVTSGPYRFTRNPMYVGLTLIYLGVAGTRAEIWPVIVLPVLFAYVNFVVIPVEERRLHDVFGDAYAQYGARVRRWL